MVEPFLAYLLAGAFLHRLLHVIAWLVGEQAVRPYAQLVLRLVAELLLTVQRPAHKPIGILNGHNAAGHHMAGERVSLADFLNIRRNLHVKRGNGGAHPLRMLRIAAEYVRVAETRVLLGDATPHIPAAAGLDLRSPCGCFGLRAHGRILHATTVSNEHQIVLTQVNASRGAIRLGQVDARGHFLGW